MNITISTLVKYILDRLSVKRGVDALHIKRLGRWESMAMVEHYTRSVRFEESLKLYKNMEIYAQS
jgi:hypothetical protein